MVVPHSSEVVVVVMNPQMGAKINQQNCEISIDGTYVTIIQSNIIPDI
jgi:uncharacterized Rossmann fold enzyme